MNRIKHYRKQGDIKLKDLAKQCGWRTPRLSNYEHERRLPSIDQGREIVAALNALGVCCSFDDVFPPEKAGEAAA